MRQNENKHAIFPAERLPRALANIYGVCVFISLFALFPRSRRPGRSSLRYALPRAEHKCGPAAPVQDVHTCVAATENRSDVHKQISRRSCVRLSTRVLPVSHFLLALYCAMCCAVLLLHPVCATIFAQLTNNALTFFLSAVCKIKYSDYNRLWITSKCQRIGHFIFVKSPVPKLKVRVGCMLGDILRAGQRSRV